jgi:CRISPR system Cascade subunit CasA
LTTLVLPGLPNNAEPSLWQRLWANVPGKRDNAASFERVFPWLVPTRISDKTGVETTPDDVDPLQCFFGMPRRIRLMFEPNTARLPCDLLGIVDDVVVTGYVTRPWGTNYTGWSRGHPLSPYYRPKKDAVEYLPLHLQSSRVGYRQYLGLALAGELRLPARCVSDFYARAQDLEGDEKLAAMNSRLLVAGYSMDNMKPLDFGEALMPLIVTGDPDNDDRVRAFAEGFVKAADLIANQLGNAVKRALFGENAKTDRGSTVLDAVRQRFWGDTEQAFYAALRRGAEALVAAGDNAGERLAELRQAAGASWLSVVRNAALDIFDDAVPIEDAASDKIKDVIEGRKMLVSAASGYGATGTLVFAALQLPPVETKAKKGKKAA